MNAQIQVQEATIGKFLCFAKVRKSKENEKINAKFAPYVTKLK